MKVSAHSGIASLATSKKQAQALAHAQQQASVRAMTVDAEAMAQVVQATLGHQFTNHELLVQACTHTSWCDAQLSHQERQKQSNERLEFLGDALLGAAMAEVLFQRSQDASEGDMSRLKSRLVSRKTLADAIRGGPLLPLFQVGSKMLEPWPDSILANYAEALLGAIYLDGGWQALFNAVEQMLKPAIDGALSGDQQGDSKSRLQEWSLKRTQELPTYSTERSGGSDHDPEFTAHVSAAGYEATGTAGSRRKAEAAAASNVLAIIARCQPPAP